MDNKKNKNINIEGSNKTFVFLHGYTGGYKDFNILPKILSKKFRANIIFPLLKGHGKDISELEKFKYNDYKKQVEDIIKEEIKKKNKIILVGYSFGGQLALYLSSKYKIEGIICIAVPYRMTFPLLTYPIINLIKIKKTWKKPFTKGEKELRKDLEGYNCVPGDILQKIKEINDDLKKRLKKVKCPILVINSNYDLWISFRSMRGLLKEVGSKIKEYNGVNSRQHCIFYDECKKQEIYNKIIKFIEYYNLFNKKEDKIDAIVCAYNESVRIENVLKVLTKVDIINKVIVIDDGSTDNLERVVKKYNVTYLKNEKNMGKAYSMDRGVKNSKASIIFFCDADLYNLKIKTIKGIINPVKKGKYDMYLGICGDWNQTWWKLVALNSGQRVLRREVWEKLPKFYKYRYRIEYGLNKFIKKFGRKMGYKVFNYSQTIKEKKHGLVKGTFLRWWLNLDVVIAILRYNFYDRFRRFNF